LLTANYQVVWWCWHGRVLFHLKYFVGTYSNTMYFFCHELLRAVAGSIICIWRFFFALFILLACCPDWCPDVLLPQK
jgi:hypothetical protein